MTAKEVVEAMARGAVLCMEHAPEGKVFWLEPKRILIRADVGERVVQIPGIRPGGDVLFNDCASQTWKAA
jgi:hypothetical protein